MHDADRSSEENDDARQEPTAGPSRVTVSRRQFLGGAAVAAGWITMAGLPWPTGANAQSCTPAPTGEELLDMLSGAIGDGRGVLQGAVRATNERRVLTALSNGTKVCSQPMLRYLEGLNAAGQKIWPPANRKGLPTPGPTLQARVGQSVQLAFLNNVNPSDFPGTIDVGKTKNEPPDAGCDVSAKAGTPGDPKWLPAKDTFPNCFHGSNASNLHFHGTHVTPSGFGDNVYIMVQPDPTMKPSDYANDFKTIFGNCSQYAFGPVDWKTAVPKTWQDKQNGLLDAYDKATQFRGQRGLPPELQLLAQNQQALSHGDWPPYNMGAFPNCFTPPATPPNPKNPFSMAQAPGTHWYHAHKHGSTAMHLYHGLAGAFIIRGRYDDDLNKLYPGLREKVIVFQEFTELPPLYRGGLKTQLVNGQFQPKITMRKGEIQLWRLVNANQGASLNLGLAGLQFKQIAQDGVQFDATNYQRQPLSTAPLGSPTQPFSVFYPGNRVDLLVKAPAAPVNVTAGGATLMSVALDGEGPDMQFPSATKYPITFPIESFRDIQKSDIRKWRRITFGWDPSKGGDPNNFTPGTGRNPKTNAPPYFMIDGKQFDPDTVDQTMDLDTAEEWWIENTTNIAHPFHIHVNPFQIIEIFDPKQSPTPFQLPGPWAWWDNFAIPANGWFKMWSRFADFTGKYVMHCHIVAHEDRGMMQAVQVGPKPKLNIPHH
jgi:FtsP/CotA-like multicopper oxidase with cupredoxin domain